jgi:hypothetical protein
MRWFAALAAAAVVGALALAAAPASATTNIAARSHPAAAFSFASDRVNAGAKPKLSYATAHLPHGSKIYLQRDFGTKHVFKSIQRLKKRSATVSTAGVQMGRYQYRIKVVHKKQVLLFSQAHRLFSYGEVTALQLCNSENNDAQFNDGCGQGTIQVGSNVYTYAVQDGEGDTGPDENADVVAQHSSCRAAYITFASSNDESDTTSLGAEISQTSADEQGATTPAGTIGTLVASISSSAWDLEFYSDSGDYVYWNGDFSCWSASGKA